MLLEVAEIPPQKYFNSMIHFRTAFNPAITERCDKSVEALVMKGQRLIAALA